MGGGAVEWQSRAGQRTIYIYIKKKTKSYVVIWTCVGLGLGITFWCLVMGRHICDLYWKIGKGEREDLNMNVKKNGKRASLSLKRGANG